MTGASAQPAASSAPAISSESLRFIWQPSVQTWKRGRAAASVRYSGEALVGDRGAVRVRRHAAVAAQVEDGQRATGRSCRSWRRWRRLSAVGVAVRAAGAPVACAEPVAHGGRHPESRRAPRRTITVSPW